MNLLTVRIIHCLVCWCASYGQDHESWHWYCYLFSFHRWRNTTMSCRQCWLTWLRQFTKPREIIKVKLFLFCKWLNTQLCWQNDRMPQYTKWVLKDKKAVSKVSWFSSSELTRGGSFNEFILWMIGVVCCSFSLLSNTLFFSILKTICKHFVFDFEVISIIYFYFFIP